MGKESYQGRRVSPIFFTIFTSGVHLRTLTKRLVRVRASPSMLLDELARSPVLVWLSCHCVKTPVGVAGSL